VPATKRGEAALQGRVPAAFMQRCAAVLLGAVTHIPYVCWVLGSCVDFDGLTRPRLSNAGRVLQQTNLQSNKTRSGIIDNTTQCACTTAQ
jgi:hypothetical protein